MIKKIISAILAVVMIAATFASCEGRAGNVGTSGHPELYAEARVSIPFVTNNLDFDRLKVIETDSYGRTMFLYNSLSTMMSDYCGKEMYAMVICQKYDKEYAYYYDNYNFVYLKNHYDMSYKPGEADEEIKKLKDWNDWDKPLNESKLSKVRSGFAHILDTPDEVKDNILKILPETTTLKYGCFGMAIDESGKRLYVIREYTKQYEQYTFCYAYFIVCDENNNVLVVDDNPCILEISDMAHCQDALKRIKEMCNWNMTE